MESMQPNPTLKRMTETNRDSAKPAGRTAAGALRLGLARAALELFDLGVSVIGIRQARGGPDAVEQTLSDDRLLVLLDGSDAARGAVALDRTLVVALIQQQIIGQVTSAEPELRAFTATDAAMIAPLIDDTLKRAAALAEIPDDIRCLSDLRFGARIEDRRTAMLVLNDSSYRLFALTLELAGGAVQGELCLIIPEQKASIDAQEADSAQEKPHLGQSEGMARADLNAVLSSIHLSLTEFSKLQPGDVLPLAQGRLDQIRLLTIEGASVAIARLGQIGGLRAVRLNETPPADRSDHDGFAAAGVSRRLVMAEIAEPEGRAVHPDQAHDDKAKIQTARLTREDTPETIDPESAANEIAALAGLDSASDRALTEENQASEPSRL